MRPAFLFCFFRRDVIKYFYVCVGTLIVANKNIIGDERCKNATLNNLKIKKGN